MKKKKVKLESFGLKPLVLRLVEDREIKDTVEKSRKTEGKVSLQSITEKVIEGELKAPPINSIRAAKSGNYVKPGDIIEKFGHLPVSICDKCPYKQHCPYFSKRKVCQFITSYFTAPRYIHKFIPYIIKYINNTIWHTSILTQKQTGYDSLDLMFAVYCFVKVIKDQGRKDTTMRYMGKHKDHKNRRKTLSTYATTNSEIETKRRKEILGLIYTQHDYIE